MDLSLRSRCYHLPLHDKFFVLTIVSKCILGIFAVRSMQRCTLQILNKRSAHPGTLSVLALPDFGLDSHSKMDACSLCALGAQVRGLRHSSRLFYTYATRIIDFIGCRGWDSKTVSQWRSIVSSSIQSLPTGMGSKVQTKNTFQPKNLTSQTQRHQKANHFFLFKTKKKPRWNIMF